jgi:hypothetical protein
VGYSRHPTIARFHLIARGFRLLVIENLILVDTVDLRGNSVAVKEVAGPIPGTRTDYGCLSNFDGRPAFRGRSGRPTARSSRSTNREFPKDGRCSGILEFLTPFPSLACNPKLSYRQKNLLKKAAHYTIHKFILPTTYLHDTAESFRLPFDCVTLEFAIFRFQRRKSFSPTTHKLQKGRIQT